MEVIRTIKTVHNGQVLLDLPAELSGRQVEIIVLTRAKSSPTQKSLRGALREYAQPNLIPLESSAWGNFLEEKYGNC